MSTPDQNPNPQDPTGSGAYQPEPMGSAEPAPAEAPADPYAQPPGGATPPPPAYGAPQQPQYAPAPSYGAPQYAQPAYGAPVRPNPKNWMGIVSLVTSILGMSLIGIIFGHLALSANKKGEADNRGLSLAGVILGYIGLVAGIIITIIVIAAIGGCANDPNCVAEFSTT